MTRAAAVPRWRSSRGVPVMQRLPVLLPGMAMPLLVAVAAAVGPVRDGRGAEPAFSSRDELIRKWDLNKDGAIDEGEVEMARSKMRRERTELQMQSGIDPLTGRLRSPADEDDAAAEAEAEPVPTLPEAEQPRPKTGKPTAPLPGTRAPVVQPPIPSPRATGPAAAGPGGTAAAPARGPGGSATYRGLSAGADQGVVTGGARAGGLARPGYGATLPKPDLNAGRLPAGPPGRRPTPASGGLLPSLRTRPIQPAPPVTPPPAPAPRRVVDDYEVY